MLGAAAADTKRVARYRVGGVENVTKASFYLDGLGGGGSLAGQVCRAVLYDSLDQLLAVGDEVLIAAGMPARWVDFPFSSLRGKLQLPVGDVFAGLHFGGASNTIRVYGGDPSGMGGKWNNDTYSDGAASPFGAATALTADLSGFVTLFTPYAPPDETDLYFSRLPFEEAQQIFALGGVVPRSARRVDVGWHSTFTDPETGSNALVRDGGPLMDLLGERVKITTYGRAVPRVVYAYVHGVAPADFEWDLSVTRLAFSRLSALSDTTSPAIVEVVA